VAIVPCTQPRTNSTPLAPAQPSPAIGGVAGRSFIAPNSLTKSTDFFFKLLNEQDFNCLHILRKFALPWSPALGARWWRDGALL
jgi:hypothetical protein